MLKTIRTEDVNLGMFLHKLEGSWLAHPFWKRRFLIQDSGQLADLKASAVEWVTIDISRGSDVASPAVPQAVPEVEGEAAPVEEAAAPEPEPEVEKSEGSDRRAQILGRARRSESASTKIPARAPQRGVPLGAAPRGLVGEMKSAADIAGRSRLVVRGLFNSVRLGKAVDIGTVEPMVDDMMRSIQRHPHAFTGVMRLMKTSDYLYTHALSVSSLMIGLAIQLGLRNPDVREAGLAGLLMDVGMGHVPAEIYDKDGDLTPDEEEIVRSHTHLAHQFMATGGDVPDAVLDVCLHHHERMDGSGYPHGLKGTEISLLARMAAVCDTYDAMTSHRPHKGGEDPAMVLDKMRALTDVIDMEIFEAFVATLGIYPVGSLVRLESGKLAMVLDQNPKNPTLPRVRAFWSTDEQAPIEPEDIELVYRLGKDSIVGPERPELWGIEDWPKMSAALFRQATGVVVR